MKIWRHKTTKFNVAQFPSDSLEDISYVSMSKSNHALMGTEVMGITDKGQRENKKKRRDYGRASFVELRRFFN